MTDPTSGWLCDAVFPTPCRTVLCNACHPGGRDETLWCPRHAPIRVIPHLGWRVASRQLHPGRDHLPLQWEARSTLAASALPRHAEQVAALSQQERSRTRVQSEIARFSKWVSTVPSRKLRRLPSAQILAQYVHAKVRELAHHPDLRRRVTRPGTPASWVRRLSDGVPKLQQAARSAAVRQLLTGYRALAPALSTSLERDNAGAWTKAVKMVDRLVAPGRPLDRQACALWLAVQLQVRGFRPLASIRASLPQSRRELRLRQGGQVWEVSVLIDKHNPTAAVQATQRRWLPVSPLSRRVMSLLPLPARLGPITQLVAARRLLLSQCGIRQTYSARRTAAAQADEAELDPGQVLSHRPGSKSTPGYVGSTTPSALCARLRPLT